MIKEQAPAPRNKMKKFIKMWLYGVPGIGKSVFAFHFPKPFFITTDNNYAFLDEWGAKEENHKNVRSWAQFLDLLKEKGTFRGYDTIVIDTLDNLYLWNQYEYLEKHNIESMQDQGYGRGYGITRQQFFITLTKLVALPRNIIIISHEVVKEMEVNSYTKKLVYTPAKDMAEAVKTSISGIMQFVLRAKFKETSLDTGKSQWDRVLSLTQNGNEFHVIRGVNIDKLPSTIPLDYKIFTNLFNLEFQSLSEEEEEILEIENNKWNNKGAPKLMTTSTKALSPKKTTVSESSGTIKNSILKRVETVKTEENKAAEILKAQLAAKKVADAEAAPVVKVEAAKIAAAEIPSVLPNTAETFEDVEKLAASKGIAYDGNTWKDAKGKEYEAVIEVKMPKLTPQKKQPYTVNLSDALGNIEDLEIEPKISPQTHEEGFEILEDDEPLVSKKTINLETNTNENTFKNEEVIATTSKLQQKIFTHQKLKGDK